MRAAGGEISHELGIIDAVAAQLTPAQRAALAGDAAVRRIYGDRDTLRLAGAFDDLPT